MCGPPIAGLLTLAAIMTGPAALLLEPVQPVDLGPSGRSAACPHPEALTFGAGQRWRLRFYDISSRWLPQSRWERCALGEVLTGGEEMSQTGDGLRLFDDAAAKVCALLMRFSPGRSGAVNAQNSGARRPRGRPG